MMMKCIIIDDEYPARVLLNEYASKIPELNVEASFKDPLEAISYLQDKSVDLIFLDIQMPQLGGVEFLKTLNNPPKVIFTTAYPDYAVEGFKLRVVDYLLKPIKFERFLEAVNKVSELLNLEKNRNTVSDDAIIIKADHRVYRLSYDEILYIEGMKEYVRFHVLDSKITTLESLIKLESILPQNQFYRVHKSYIVNKKMVKSLYANQLEIGESLIPVGKSYREEVIKKLF